MELGVEVVERRAVQAGPGHPLQRLLHLGGVDLADALGQATDGAILERHAYPHDVGHGIAGDGYVQPEQVRKCPSRRGGDGHSRPGTGTRAAAHDLHCLEDAYCLPHGRPADLELLAQFSLTGKPVARLEPSGEDLLLDPTHDQFIGLGAHQRLEVQLRHQAGPSEPSWDVAG